MTLLALTPLLALLQVAPDSSWTEARANAALHQQSLAAAQRLLHAWLKQADPKTLLLPDRTNFKDRIYTPHNSGADLYPYLILTSRLTDPAIYSNRMLHMLRNEVRYTNARAGVPGNLNLNTGELGPPSLFGAGEYAKDGLITVTEYLGRTPWTARMIDMIADAMEQAPVDSAFGKLPAKDSELNGDYLQVLPRLYLLTGDERFLAWARRIADAYTDEVLAGNFGLPSMNWDFGKHTGDAKLKLRDHGNEMIVGLVTQFALESQLGSPRAAKMRPVMKKMLDRVLESANADGMLYNTIDTQTLKPLDERLSDNWGYVYGAVYTYSLVTGEDDYLGKIRHVLSRLPNYRNWTWEPSGNAKNPRVGSFDGYADSIESALYLASRVPVKEAFDWIDSEMQVMLGMQRADGQVEDWYGEGNFNRTALLYGLMKSRGVRAAAWRPGLGIGATVVADELRLALSGPAKVEFDFARHRRVHNWRLNIIRLNEYPEWFTVDENRLYRVERRDGSDNQLRLGSELIAGVELSAGDWTVKEAKQ